MLEAQPRGAATVTVHAEGPGISVTRTYRDEPARADRASVVGQAFWNDPAFVMRATGPGEVRLRAEFEGVSREATGLRWREVTGCVIRTA